MRFGVEVFVVIVFSFILGLCYNSLIIPNNLLSGGVTGISILLNHVTSFNSGTLNLLINIPILIIGYLKLGKKLMILTIISVLTISLSMMFLPTEAFVDDLLLASIFGGVFSGICLGMIFKFSASSGGFDIISLIILLKKDMRLGLITFSLNAIVIFISGFFFDWESALYTLIYIYVTSVMIDNIHTSNIKVTLTIISDKGEELEKGLLNHFKRGITVLNGRGSFTNSEKHILYMVVTRYELSDIKEIINEIDSNAFVNITQTLEIFGNFRKVKPF